MLDNMPLRLFYDWMEYYRRFSFGDELANYRQAITSCVIANANRGKGKSPYKVEDFIVSSKKKPKQSNTQLIAMMTALTGKAPPKK